MEMSLQVEGCEELAFNLRGLAADVRDKFTIQALKAGGAVVRDYSQAEAPVGETGQLATSIVVSVKGGAVLVGPNKQPRNDKGDDRHMRNDSIGIMQEKGTVNHFNILGGRVSAAEARKKKRNQLFSVERKEERMPARPFMEKALEESAQEAFQAEATKLRELIETRQMKGV